MSPVRVAHSDNRERWDNNCSGVDDDRESTDISKWPWLVNCHSWRHYCHRLTHTDRCVLHTCSDL